MDETTEPNYQLLRRIGGIAIGCATQALFLFTVWHLFWFLKDGCPASSIRFAAWDLFLAVQYVVPHSVLLLPAVKKRLLPYITSYFYGSFYCMATCVGLLTAIFLWRGSSSVLWDLQGSAKLAVQVGFGLSWVALFYSLSLTGLGYQTGLTEWVAWLRRQPLERRTFRPRGAYLLLRHPVYLSFLGLIWFTPRMSLDHALLTGIWTTYILVGSVLKDQRLAYYLGQEYRAYAQRVKGYPLVGVGPLARWPEEPAAQAEAPCPTSQRAA